MAEFRIKADVQVDRRNHDRYVRVQDIYVGLLEYRDQLINELQDTSTVDPVVQIFRRLLKN
jgi:hypothetical protein